MENNAVGRSSSVPILQHETDETRDNPIKSEAVHLSIRNPIRPGVVRKLENGFLLEFLGLTEDVPDANGLFEGLVLPKAQYMYLWFLSWLSLISGIVAIARGHYDLCFVPIGVWFTSILYWWHPDFSWRRYLDMAYVQLSLWYQVYRAVGAENMIAYYTLTIVAVMFFPLGLWIYKRSRWGSTLCHGMVHILGNVGNLVLYAGFVLPLRTSL